MPAVDDEMMVKPPRKSAVPRKSKLKGEDPYIPFKARPLPASITERMNLCKAPAGTKTPSSAVCYIRIVQVSYVSHISHPTKTTTMVKPLPPLAA